MLRKGRSVLLGLAVAPYALIAATGGQAKPTYAGDVLPTLKAHCASCHSGPSASAGLDLTSSSGIKRVIKPRDSKDSLLVQRLRGIGGAQMPMGFAPLPRETIDRIAMWIDNGADIGLGVTKHWAYIRPIRPIRPIPTTKNWARNMIDDFVLARLEKEGLKPSPEASKEKLLRRVYLDLIGLPPSPKEIDAFLTDKRPDAYERVVDSLLKNPHYGERQAEPWLDLSRYADSDGYEKDLNRTAWKYRDWLIDAFNRNLPYDRFTIEQLAGDLLPNPTQDQMIATGFNRNTMFNREGGVDQEDAHFNVVLDRVGTTATVWLGSTLQCARCHDHKYDPFTQRDFYRMAAFYANSQIYPEGPKAFGEEKWFETQMRVPSPQQEAEERKLKTDMAEIQRRLAAWTPELNAGYTKWLEDSKKGPAWTVLQPDRLTSKNGATLSIDGFGVITSNGKLPSLDDYTLSGKAGLTHLSGISIEAIADSSLPSRGPGRSANGNFVVSHVKVSAGGVSQPLSRAVADYEQKAFGAARVFSNDRDAGWAVLGATGKSHEIVLELAKPIDVQPDTPVEVVIEQHWSGGEHLLGKFRVSLTQSEHPAMLFLPRQIRELVAVSSHGDAGDRALKDYFLTVAPMLDPDRAKLAQLRKDLAMLESKIPTALVMKDKPHTGPLTAYVHQRGEFLSPTELVTAGYPAALCQTTPIGLIGPMSPIGPTSPPDPAPVPHINDNGDSKVTGSALTRLDLAKWLVSRENPLTARVEVNRLWEQFFGRGIVETSEDFGTQGARPSHPELLDWLACEFMDKGWDMKAMVRLIVTSATYRQSSDASPALEEKDPQNILLARGPRVRLDAETIRDSLLADAGLLSTKIGGPSVYPPQPAGVWDTPYNGEQWMESKGEDRYRRGLYTFVKRSSPYPTFLNFDSTSRESCTVRRIRTNTPLQALAMLNDKVVLEAAKALGNRMQTEGGDQHTQRLAYGFRLCTGRRPTTVEIGRLDRLFKQLVATYGKDPASANKIAGTTLDAAWTMVANVLLNLDETVTKG
ncbi:MAG: DUF1553 domain-containing protein [Fimbriimonadales bacterium]